MTPSRQSHPSPAPVEAAEQSASAIRITSIYIAAAVLWIALSDLLITGIAGRLADHWLLQTAKGWGFVILTGLLLYRVLARDERRRMRLMAELQDNARWFQDLFELSPSPMWVCRLDDLRFLAVNRAAQAQYGYSEQEFLRMTIAEVRPAEDVPALLEAFQRVREGFAKSGTWRHRRKDGGLIDAEIFSARVEFDRQPALLVLALDVTARCAAQRALAESEERLRLAMQAAHQGLYDVDVRTGAVQINEEFARMLGYAPEDLSMSAQRWVELLHPEDRERAVVLYHDFLGGRVPDYRSEFRLRAADGTWRWMLSIGSIIERGGDGRPLRMLGTHTDISLEKEKQARIEWLARLRSVLAAINEAVVQFDDRDALLAEACRITVELGGLRMAWIGWVGEDGEVALAASHGAGISYLTGIRISTDPSRPEGNGPPGQAIRLGAPVVVNDFLADARTARWQVAAREAGFGASAAFPLRIGRAVVGTLNVYAAEPGFFTDELTALLSQVAGDLALGLDRQTAVSALRRGERLLAQAEQIAHLGSWELDLARGAGSWSAEMYRLMRRDPAAGPPTFDEFLAAVHPDDKAVIADAQARVFRDRTPVRLEYRSHPDLGPERTFLSTIYVESEPDGLLVRLVGTTQDVTEQRQAEEPARRWQQIFAASQLALAHADAATNVFIDVSQAFAREHGYTIAELVGQPLAMVYPPDVWESVHRAIANLDQTGHAVFESVHRRKDGSRFPVLLDITVIRDDGGRPVSRIAYALDITERQAARERLAHQAEELRALSRRLLRVQEEERRALARELHDEIGQQLAALKINLAVLQQRLKEGEEAQRTADCLDITDVTISRLRDTALNLRPSVLDDLGLAPALYWYARRQSERASCRIDVRADLPALPKDVETAAFRITQEAVNNAVRHARPTAIDITAQLREDRLDLRIRDDGTGFQPEDPTAEHGGMGLLGMRERAALLGGALQVESRPGGGTLITATIPIDGAAR